MALRPIVMYPEPVLLRPCPPVRAFDDELRRLAGEMLETMYAAGGVGLAANQVGVPLQLLVIDVTAGSDPGARVVACNPEIVLEDGEQAGEEGCLSLPGIVETIRRPLRVRVRFARVDDGAAAEGTGEGLLARVWCHEVDHLRGRTILDRVSNLRRALLKQRIRRLVKEGSWG